MRRPITETTLLPCFALAILVGCADRASTTQGERAAGIATATPLPRSIHASVGREASALETDVPDRASGNLRLQARGGNQRLSVSLLGADATNVEWIDGVARYRGALGGADTFLRITPDGVEDYVLFNRRPTEQTVRYVLDVSEFAGLRLVRNILELVDRDGVPRLRVDPPSLLDAGGRTVAADLAIEGCAVDANPASPYGRSPTPPGSPSCTMRIAWDNVAYPALLDPSWTATGTMTTARARHASVLLSNGKVLIAGGTTGTGVGLVTAELYDPATRTFAATGALTGPTFSPSIVELPGGKALIVEGDYEQTARASVYDATTGLFTATVGALPKPARGVVLLQNGKVLLAAGPENYLFDTGTRLFTATASLPSIVNDATEFPRVESLTLLPSGKALAFRASISEAAALVYDPVSSSFSSAGQPSVGFGHTATLLRNGKVLIAGGHQGIRATSAAMLFDPATNNFTALSPMSAQREYLSLIHI